MTENGMGKYRWKDINTALPFHQFDVFFYGTTPKDRMIQNGPPPWADRVPNGLSEWFDLIMREGYMGEKVRVILQNISKAFSVDPIVLMDQYQELDGFERCETCGEVFLQGDATRDDVVRHRLMCDL